METSTVSIFRHMFFFMTIVIVFRAIMSPRGLRDKALYYEFCQLRRELTHLVLADKVNVHSLSFEFFMRFLSDIIHYCDDYNLGTRTFLKCIQRDSKDLSDQPFLQKLKADAEKQQKEFQELVDKIFVATIRLFERNPVVWLIIRIGFLYYAIKHSRPKSSYTQAADTVKNVRSAVCTPCFAA